jgi:maltoporin
MQRLDNPYQFQTIPSPNRFGVGTTDVIKLDRPRTVETLKLTHYLRHLSPNNDKLGFKVIVYGEAHQLAAGTQRDPLTAGIDRPLPSDSGWLLGTQVGLWTGERDTHVNLFFRHARGVAAYDPLSTPSTFANDRTTSGSTETLVALGANYEIGSLGVLAGAYLRFFRDGDPSPTSTQKFDEGTVVVRPQVFLGEHFGIAVEGSMQQRRLAVLDPATDSALTATVFKGGLIPYFSPSGRGAFKRPQLRLLYAVSGRDSGARALYPVDDVFAHRTVEHFIGIGAEWWFNSSSYP